MAIQVTVYSNSYPSNTKTVTVDVVSQVPLGAEGDEKYLTKVSTTAYSDNTNRTSIDPVFLYELNRGWAQSHVISSPILVDGDKTLTIAMDEADSGAVTITVSSGTYAGSTLASHFQTEIRATASGSGAKASASNRLSYANAQVSFEESRLTFYSGSIKESFNDADWSKTSSVHVTGGTGANDPFGFYTGYPNSYDLTSTVSGGLIGPASAVVSMDDAVTFAIMTIVNQIDFSS